MEQEPVFIVGAQRSGTTMLRLMLTTHPKLSIPPESLFFINLEEKFSKRASSPEIIDQFVDDLYRDEKFIEWNVDRTLLRDRLHSSNISTYAQLVAHVYHAYADKYDEGWSLWGDKNPDYISHIPTILTHFPKAKIIHIIRDVRAIYNSFHQKAVLKHGSPLEDELFLIKWRYDKVLDVFQRSSNSNLYTICYEKLVAAPQQELKDLCTWLAIEYDPSMEQFFKVNAEKGLVPKKRLHWHHQTLHPANVGRINAWREELTRSDIEAVELLNAKAISLLGYELITGPFRVRGILRVMREYLRRVERKMGFSFLKGER